MQAGFLGCTLSNLPASVRGAEMQIGLLKRGHLQSIAGNHASCDFASLRSRDLSRPMVSQQAFGQIPHEQAENADQKSLTSLSMVSILNMDALKPIQVNVEDWTMITRVIIFQRVNYTLC